MENKKNALLRFYEHLQGNCKIQCTINKDEEITRNLFDKLNISDHFFDTIEKLKNIYEGTDSLDFMRRGELVNKKHKRIYEYYLSLFHETNTHILQCNLL